MRSSAAFVAGAVAGAVDTSLTMPLDTIKTQMQLKRYSSPLACSRSIIKADGVHGLYYGFRPFLLQASGKAAVRFFMYENICAAVDRAGFERSRAPAKWSMACGMGAGLCEALFWTAPTERLKVLRQAAAGTGTGGGSTTVMTVVREQGIGGLYVGALPTALRQATSTAIRFSTLAHIKRVVCGALGYDAKAAPSWLTFLAGGTAGSVSAVLNNPIDVVKSRIQSYAARATPKIATHTSFCLTLPPSHVCPSAVELTARSLHVSATCSRRMASLHLVRASKLAACASSSRRPSSSPSSTRWWCGSRSGRNRGSRRGSRGPSSAPRIPPRDTRPRSPPPRPPRAEAASGELGRADG